MTSSRHHNEYVDNAACFWTSSVVNFVPALSNSAAAECLLGLWDRYRKAYEVKIIGYVIMPNHFHMVIWSEIAENTKRFLRRTLGLSSLEIAGIYQRSAETGDARASAWLKVFRTHAASGSEMSVWKGVVTVFLLPTAKRCARSLHTRMAILLGQVSSQRRKIGFIRAHRGTQAEKGRWRWTGLRAGRFASASNDKPKHREP